METTAEKAARDAATILQSLRAYAETMTALTGVWFTIDPYTVGDIPGEYRLESGRPYGSFVADSRTIRGYLMGFWHGHGRKD